MANSIYDILHWKDHVVETPNKKRFIENSDGTVIEEKVQGEIIQQGTAQSATNFNNMEAGIYANSVIGAFLVQEILQLKKADEGEEIIDVEINDNTRFYPFNSINKSVAMSKKRNVKSYKVEAKVLESDSVVDEVVVFDRQLNGFKIAFKGLAKNVKIQLKIRGGLYK